MYKYKCVSRFNIILLINNEIRELRPQEVLESKTKIDHSKLRLIKPPIRVTKQVDNIKEKKKVKSNADSRS